MYEFVLYERLEVDPVSGQDPKGWSRQSSRSYLVAAVKPMRWLCSSGRLPTGYHPSVLRRLSTGAP
jgi:hypothetical protein